MPHRLAATRRRQAALLPRRTWSDVPVDTGIIMAEGVADRLEPRVTVPPRREAAPSSHDLGAAPPG